MVDLSHYTKEEMENVDMENNNTCKEHLAYNERLKDLEENMKALWGKYDSIQKLLFIGITGVVGNLVGIIIILLTR